jgi:hypothetical protein
MSFNFCVGLLPPHLPYLSITDINVSRSSSELNGSADSAHYHVSTAQMVVRSLFYYAQIDQWGALDCQNASPRLEMRPTFMNHSLGA